MAPGYYGIAPIHKPHWKWLIILYFYLGGIAGGSATIAALAHLFGRPEDRTIVRAGRYLSLAALLPCPILLILDLGRPSRFHHMLRGIHWRSPMSTGSWGLTCFGGLAALAALIQSYEDQLALTRRLHPIATAIPARPISALSIPTGLFVAGYTGVLLAATAVPLWAKNALLMGPLFLSSAISTATAAISLVLARSRQTHPATLERLANVEQTAILTELATLTASRIALGSTARPLTTGRLGALLHLGTIGTGLVAPLILHCGVNHRGREISPTVTSVTATFVLFGGFILRYVVVIGGHQSADDPEATFAMTRGPRGGEDHG